MKSRWVFFALCWLTVVVGGSAMLMIHSQTPGEETGRAPERWPAASQIPRVENRPTLVMFAHPKCPCTRASIEELAILMARCQGLVNAKVVFFKPEDAAEDWNETDTWKSAAAIPGVEVQSDKNGSEAANFDASISGHVVLYDAQGQLLFSGGITEARGHAGDNEGLTSIVNLLRGKTSTQSATPIFGCPIQEKESGSLVVKDS